MSTKRLLFVMSVCGLVLVSISVASWRYCTGEFNRAVLPQLSPPAVVATHTSVFNPTAVNSSSLKTSNRWRLRSKHFLLGMPEIIDDRYDSPTEEEGPELSVLVREGFVIGHLDRAKIPLWMCMRWNRENLAASLAEKERRRKFEVDKELPEHAQGDTSYDQSGIDRGHLARNKDNLAWGEDNASSGDLMSNIVPQLSVLNRGPWYELEKVISVAPEKRVAKDQTFWIIAGSVFDGGRIKKRIGNGIGVPDSYYKIVAWYDRTGRFRVMAFLFPFDATVKNPTKYLTSVDEVEICTGLNFFPDLDPAISVAAESVHPTAMWEE